jgi:hypothetical protein
MARGFLSEDELDRERGRDVTAAIDGVRCLRASKFALFVRVPSGGDGRAVQFWVPQSVVHDDSEVYAEGHEGLLVLREWWWERKRKELGL